MEQLDIQITDQDLPVLSAVATQALETLQDPNVTNRKMEELIRQDPALTERVLRTANSPFYAGHRQSTTISEAITRLGLRQLRNIIVVAATGELFHGDDAIIHGIWDHAFISALTAHWLADLLKVSQVDESFIAGMLHDVGRLIIYRQHPDVYRELTETSVASNKPIFQLENEWFKYFNHMSVGGLVVRKWRLSNGIAESARFHHDLGQSIPELIEHRNLACLVALADLVVSHLGYTVPVCAWEEIPQQACAQHLRFAPRHQEGLREKLQADYEAHRSSFG